MMVSGNAVSLESHVVPLGFGARRSCSGTRVSSYLPLREIDGIMEYSVFLEHRRGGVEISTLLSAALSALQNF